MFERGKVILVPFPFTDLSAQKVRPALIVSKRLSGEGDMIVVFISSVIPKKIRPTDYLISSDHPNFDQVGLKFSSLIRCDKIATLDKKIVLGELGKLSTKDLHEVDQRLRKTLGL